MKTNGNSFFVDFWAWLFEVYIQNNKEPERQELRLEDKAAWSVGFAAEQLVGHEEGGGTTDWLKLLL